MSNSTVRDEIRDEVYAFLKGSGLPLHGRRTALSQEDQRKAVEIARRIIDSNFDASQLGHLDHDLLSAVAVTVEAIISSRFAKPLRELEEMNPYYSPHVTQLVRDR